MSPFIHGALFWGGLGLVSIPVIIHLINRRRFRRLDWAAMEFLIEALRRNRRRIRLEHLILLLLRTALVLLIVLAVARPHLAQQSFAWLSAPFRSQERVFVVDDSLSMAHVDSGRGSFSRGVDALVTALERVAADGGRDPVTILRTSRYEAPVCNAVQVDAERLEGLRRELRGGSFRPTAVRLDLTAALRDIASRSHPERGRVVTVITDLARVDWTDGQGQARSDLRRALEQVTGGSDNPSPVILLDVGSARRENISITDFRLEAANAIVGIAVDLSIEVTNFGREPARAVGLRLVTAASQVPGPRLAELGPGETRRVQLPHVFRESGSTWIRAELEGGTDGLREDDRRSLAVEVLDAVPVLIVDGQPSGVVGEGESDFLAQALRPEGTIGSGFEPLVVVEANLPTENLDRFGVIFLANVARVDDGFARRLGDYVRGGGGLVIFPGDQVDVVHYENVLGAGTAETPAVDLLPATLADISGDVDRPVHVAPVFDHPSFALLAGGGEELFGLVDVARYFLAKPRESARVVARLTDADALPLLVERFVGAGRVALFTTAADLAWSNWPRNPTFLPVMLELATELARPQGAGWNRVAGVPAAVPVDLGLYQRGATLQDPDYPSTPQRSLLATQVETRDAAASMTDGVAPETAPSSDPEVPEVPSFRFQIEDTRRAGVYALTLKTLAGDEETRHLALNAEAAESDLRQLAVADLERLYEGVPLRVVRDASVFAEADQGRFEIADLLLALFLGVMLLEGFLAWRFAHHARSRRAGEGVAAADRRSAHTSPERIWQRDPTVGAGRAS